MASAFTGTWLSEEILGGVVIRARSNIGPSICNKAYISKFALSAPLRLWIKKEKRNKIAFIPQILNNSLSKEKK